MNVLMLHPQTTEEPTRYREVVLTSLRGVGPTRRRAGHSKPTEEPTRYREVVLTSLRRAAELITQSAAIGRVATR